MDHGDEPASTDTSPGTTAPPMVRPREGTRGMVPIRSGRRMVLGYSLSGAGEARYYLAPRGAGAARKATWFPGDEAGWDAAWRAFEQAEPGNAAEYRRQATRVQERRAPAGAPLGPISPRAAATRTLNALLVSGAVVSLTGFGLFLGCGLARTTALADGNDAGGLSLAIVFSACVALVGIALALVGLVGWGVKLGREAADVS